MYPHTIMHKDKYFEAVGRFSIISVTDLQGRILYVNDNFCRISGYSRAELLGKPHRIVNSGQHPESFWANMWETIKRGEAWTGEVKNRHKNGTYYWVYTLITPIRNERGNVVEYFSQRFDITEKKKLEAQKLKDKLNLQVRDEELQTQHEELLAQMQQINTLHDELEIYSQKMENALHFSPLWIFTLDAKLRVQFANKAFHQRFPLFPENEETPSFFQHINSSRLKALIHESIEKKETIHTKSAFNLEVNNCIEHFFLEVTIVPKTGGEPNSDVTLYIQDRTAERKHIKRQEELGEIIERASTEIYIFRKKDWRFVFMNQEALEMTGYSADEIFNITPLTLKPTYTAKEFEALLNTLNESEQKSLELSTVHRRKDNTEYLARLILQPIRYQGEEAYMAVGRDITLEELKSEIMLSVSRTAKVAGWVYLPKDKKLILSGNLNNSFLTSPSHAQQNPELLYSNLTAKSSAKRKQALEKLRKQEISNYDLELESSDGESTFWLREIVTVNTRNGEIINFMGAVQDITEIVSKRQLEHKLHARYRIAAQAADLGIFEWNLKDNVIYWDESMQKLYKTSKSKLSLAEWLEFIHVSDRANFHSQMVKSQKSTLKNQRVSFRLAPREDKSAELVHIQQYLERIKNEDTGETSLIGVNINASHFKEAEHKLEQLNQELIEKNNDLSQFTYITSHNLRSPLANIIGLVELYDKENLENPFNTEIVKNVQDSAAKLDAVIQDLVQVIDVQRARKQMFTLIPLEEVINKSLDSFQRDFQALGAATERIIQQDLHVKGIYSYFQSIFENLISNAIKYRHPDRILKIEVRAKHYSEFTVVSFTDNGIGIDLKANKEKVFGFYQRFHTKRPGKGLGLYMVKSQIEAMGGQIDVQSFPDKGTTFVLYFPDQY